MRGERGGERGRGRIRDEMGVKFFLFEINFK